MKQLPFIFGFLSLLFFSCSDETESLQKSDKEEVISSVLDTIQSPIRFADNGLKSTFEAISKPAQTFSIDNSKDTVLIGEEGTTLIIPQNTFTNSSGKNIENIELELVEAFTIGDMLANGLSTTSNGKLLETDGMIFLNAKDKSGNNLKIADDKTIYVETPSYNPIPDMQIFNGKYTADGKLDWENPTPTDKYLTNLPLEQLDFYPEGYKNTLVSFQNNVQLMLVQDEICQIDEKVIKFLYKKQFQNTLISTKEFETRMRVIHQFCLKDVLRMYLDNIDLNLWEVDSMAYELLNEKKYSISEAFRVFRDQRKTKVKNGRKKDEIYQKFIANFYRKQEEEKERKRQEELAEQKRLEQEFLDEQKRLQEEQRRYQEQFEQQLEQQRKISTQRQKLLNSFSIKKLGWINCDRFFNFPEARFVRSDFIIESSKLTFCQMYVVFLSVKGLLPLYSVNPSQFRFDMKVPKDQKVKLIAIGKHEKSTFFGMKEITLGQNSQEKISLKPVTSQELKKELQKCNRPTLSPTLSI